MTTRLEIIEYLENQEMKEPLEQFNRMPIHIQKAIIETYDKYEIRIEDVTCSSCRAATGCPWAFDAYNTGGDCLALK